MPPIAAAFIKSPSVFPVTLSTALLTVFAIELVVLYEFDAFEFEYELELAALPLFAVFAVGSHPVKPSIKPIRNGNNVIDLICSLPQMRESK